MNRLMVYHFIDHSGWGTMHNIILPLCKKYKNHKMFTLDSFSSELEIRNLKFYKNYMIIIHYSGSKSSYFIENYKKLFGNKKIYIFMHTSVNYQIFKKRDNFINKLKDENLIILVPSKEVAVQYKKYGINATPIQLGINIDTKKYKKHKKELAPYYNKIITTCNSKNDVYRYVKGIDRFEKLIYSLNLEDDALIAGYNYEGSKIKSYKFSEEDFLNILDNSKVYVQLSRYETYNISAVQAKRLKIPVLLLNVEGTASCMKKYVLKNENDLKLKLQNILHGDYNKKVINHNYKDSKKRENLVNFKRALEEEYFYEMQITKRTI